MGGCHSDIFAKKTGLTATGYTGICTGTAQLAARWLKLSAACEAMAERVQTARSRPLIRVCGVGWLSWGFGLVGCSAFVLASCRRTS